MLDYEKRLYIESLFKNGLDAQKRMFIEEIGETLIALNKITKINKGCSNDELLNEFVDMLILLEEMILLFDVKNEFNEIKKMKLKNLEVLLMDV